MLNIFGLAMTALRTQHSDTVMLLKLSKEHNASLAQNIVAHLSQFFNLETIEGNG